jgi:hypothetical protein
LKKLVSVFKLVNPVVNPPPPRSFPKENRLVNRTRLDLKQQLQRARSSGEPVVAGKTRVADFLGSPRRRAASPFTSPSELRF